jgi:hypothetical protein
MLGWMLSLQNIIDVLRLNMDGYINQAYPEEDGIWETWKTEEDFMKDNKGKTFRIV